MLGSPERLLRLQMTRLSFQLPHGGSQPPRNSSSMFQCSPLVSVGTAHACATRTYCVQNTCTHKIKQIFRKGRER